MCYPNLAPSLAPAAMAAVSLRSTPAPSVTGTRPTPDPIRARQPHRRPARGCQLHFDAALLSGHDPRFVLLPIATEERNAISRREPEHPRHLPGHGTIEEARLRAEARRLDTEAI